MKKNAKEMAKELFGTTTKVVKKNRGPKIDRNSPYADKNGRFKLPELSPNCFGLAVHYTLTSEDVEKGFKAYGADFSNDINGDGFVLREPLKAGDVIECGQYTVRNTPYKKKQRVGERVTPEAKDYCTITSEPPGTIERVEALREYYAQFDKEDDLLGDEELSSPFSRSLLDIATYISKSAIGKAFEAYDRKEIEAE